MTAATGCPTPRHASAKDVLMRFCALRSNCKRQNVDASSAAAGGGAAATSARVFPGPDYGQAIGLAPFDAQEEPAQPAALQQDDDDDALNRVFYAFDESEDDLGEEGAFNGLDAEVEAGDDNIDGGDDGPLPYTQDPRFGWSPRGA